MTLIAQSLSAGYGSKIVIKDISFGLPKGMITALIGPNGAGKPTLMQALAGLVRPLAGEVMLGGQPIHRIPRRRIARRLAYLPQNPMAPEGISVTRLVSQSRFSHMGLLGSFGPADRAAVEKSLACTALSHMAHRPLSALSGGERQRAWIAAMLAQEADLLLLDEPTSFLDIGHQIEVLDLLTQLCRDEGKTVLIAIHDIGHAAAIADRIAVMDSGAVHFLGPPPELMKSDIVNNVFHVRGRFQEGTGDAAPVFVPFMGRRYAKSI